MPEYKRLLQIIAEIESRAAACDDDYLVSHLARYACSLACAALEIGVKQAIETYVQRRSGPQVAKYVNKQLRYMQNPKPDTIRSLLDAFDAEWATRLDEVLNDDGGRIKESIGSLVGQRNTIAHGRNSDVSFGRLRPWINDAERTVQFVEQLGN
jgi:RiboL-PSP-HEPN